MASRTYLLCVTPTLLDLPLEVLTGVCKQLDLRDLVRVAETCKRFRRGDGGLETVELATESPLVAALHSLAFRGGELVPNTRPAGCSDSWVTYVARCARQRCCREAPCIAAGPGHALFVDGIGILLASGFGLVLGDANTNHTTPIPVSAMVGVRVRSVAAGHSHSLTLSWDGRVYSWGANCHGQLGHGDKEGRLAPALIRGVKGVLSIAAAEAHSLAATQSGAVFSWGSALISGVNTKLRPTLIEGFGEGVRVRRVYTRMDVAFAICEADGLFS
jgi:hypothetical protein